MSTFVMCASAGRPLVENASSLSAASQLLTLGARCVVVPRAFNKAKVLPPPNFDIRNIRLPSTRSLPLDPHVELVLKQLAAAYCEATGCETSRGRVARVHGTPCPKAHVDRLHLRALVTLQGPGVVILSGKDPDAVVLRANTGDAVFMTGFSDDDPSLTPVWHRSPIRADWMPDRLVVQVDDW